MFEINLVPQIKRDALRTQKIRNLVIAACILVGAVCGVILAIFGTTYAVQRAITSSRTAQIEENTRTLNEADNLLYYLTLQKQLDELGETGDQKVVFSRVLGIVSDIIPKNPQNGDPLVQFSELNYLATNYQVTIDAQTTYGFEALNSLERTIERLYYDYGVYRGPNDEIIEIEREEIDNDTTSPTYGIIYGITRGQDGSELRIYRNGNPNEAGFYFESACTAADGMTSECKLIPTPHTLDELPSFDNPDGVPTVRFKITFSIDAGALNVQNRFVRVLGIPRQDVTDSYLQINSDWFVSAPPLAGGTQ